MSRAVRVLPVVVCGVITFSGLMTGTAQAQTATAGQLIISEFRLRGMGGATDEFIEIYNNTNAPHTVTASSGSGYGIAASDGVTRCTMTNGAIIPARGHFLCVNSGAYALGAQAVGDATYTTDIPDNAGIAIFNNNTGGASYSLANRLDAVGATTEANAVYREGAGLPAVTPLDINASFTRRMAACSGSTGSGGCGTVLLVETSTPYPFAVPIDTNFNSLDFIFVDTNGTDAGAGPRLGAPGP